MADIAQLERALRNADAAGDEAGARVIAQAIMAQRQAAETPSPKSPLERFMQNLSAGALRGAGSIGATLLTPYDLLAGNTKSVGNPERRAAMDEALRGLGADTDSAAFGGGKMLGEVAGTAGVGGVAGNAIARVAPSAANVANAVRTAGMTGGNMLTRSVGAALTGGLSAGLANPDDAVVGAAVGGALPAALKAAGTAGGAVGSVLRSSKKKAADDLARALSLGDRAGIAEAVAKLRAAEELVPGSRPTVAQALQTPQAGMLQRVVHDSPGGEVLRDALAGQSAARMAALEGVAPTVPTGARDAQNNMGRAIIDFAKAGDAAAKQRTRDAFAQVPLDEASMYLPLDQFKAARDKFFGPGSFGARDGVDEALRQAEALGLLDVPAVGATKAGAAPMSLAQAVRKAGGISITNNDGLRGEIAGLRGDLKNLVRTNGGMTPGRMAEKMAEAGYIGDESADTLIQALRNEAMGGRSASMFDDVSRQFGVMRDAAMGDAPAAGSIPKQATLREVQNLRSSIGEAQRKAAKEGNDRAAAALSSMKQAIDDRIDEVVRGDGAIDENIPIDWANKLTDALAAKKAQVAQFRTGPQADIFRQGAGGAPLVQGGEAAAKFWGARPGLADDVKSFKRLIGDNPRLLGQFRSMVTTEGASTATAGGNLSSKFVRWVENTLPGLRETFDADQVRVLQRIAQDIKRAESAAAAGMSRGSNTYQNASNALSLGLLDSPLVNMAANRIPVVGQFTGPMLEGLRSTAKNKKAQQMAGLLADANVAADALGGLVAPQAGLLGASGDLALPWLYRAAPVLSTSP